MESKAPPREARVLQLSGEPYRVIGVLPPDFYSVGMSNPAEKPEIFMPLLRSKAGQHLPQRICCK